MTECNRKIILKELKKLLESERCKDVDSVSLYDVKNIIRREREQYELTKESLEEKFDYILKNNINKNSSSCVHDFDYKKNLFCFGFKYDDEWEELTFYKKTGEMHSNLKDDFFGHKNDCLTLLGSELSKGYDSLIKYKDLHNQISFEVNSTNSIFKVNIWLWGVDVKYSDFKLNHSSFDNKTKINIYFDVLGEKLDEIFNKIFVKIEDCPKWMQEELAILRYNELKEEETKAKAELYKELKRERRLILKHKLFPWTKK